MSSLSERLKQFRVFVYVKTPRKLAVQATRVRSANVKLPHTNKLKCEDGLRRREIGDGATTAAEHLSRSKCVGVALTG